MKIVLTSHINASGTGANVMIGDRPLVRLKRDEGFWTAITPSGAAILPQVRHTHRDERGELTGEVKLGAMIKFLRESIEAKMKGAAMPEIPSIEARRSVWQRSAA